MTPNPRYSAAIGGGAVSHVADDLYRILVETVRDYAIFALDPTGHVLTWNSGASRIKGYTAQEIVGRHFSTFYTQEDLDEGKPARELRIAIATGRYEEEGWRVRKDGTHFWANVVITALHDDQGQLVGFAKVTRDLTERRLAERRRLDDARHMAEVEAANKAKTEFLATMSHELRTPLNAIAGYVDLLIMGVRGPVSEAQQHDLDRIRRSQQHLLGIINDLLNYSRVEGGQVTYRIESVPIGPLVEAVRAMVQPQAHAKQVTLTAPESETDLRVLADPSKLQQILLNLLFNAVKFTGEGGSVTVTCRAEEGQTVVEVSDTGHGIAANEQETVFEPFVQLGRTLSSSHEGSGLGLSISRHLARAMGGNLTLVSEEGVGSTFSVHLPRG